jgi:hypothetical protein
VLSREDLHVGEPPMHLSHKTIDASCLYRDARLEGDHTDSALPVQSRPRHVCSGLASSVVVGVDVLRS